MIIIPVIDIKNGIVVSAQQGLRESYQPIQSTLCTSSTIESVLKGFLSLYAFDIFYIADLNAITNTGDNGSVIEKIINENPSIEFWIDNGKKMQNSPSKTELNYRLVIGSESQQKINLNTAESFLKKHILSLDYFPEKGYTGAIELFENTELWPKQVIIMCLDRVGKNNGPDFKKLTVFSEKHPDTSFIAAGGITNEDDLINLKKIGINHALVASALHSGKINSTTIQKLQAKKCPDQ